jgi:predicted metal-dependent hydrolase
MDGRCRPDRGCWRWYAPPPEETEHKAVAFDVYHSVHGNRWLLRRSDVAEHIFFTFDTTWRFDPYAQTACCGT